MNSNEIKDLITEIFICFPKKLPDMYIKTSQAGEYHSEAEGNRLVIGATDISESALNCIKSIVQKRKLKIIRGPSEILIYTPKEVKEETEVTTEVPTEPVAGAVDEATLKRVLEMVKYREPVVSVWNKEIMICFKYLVLTKPAFKVSEEAADMLKKAIKKKYPKLWRRVQQALS